MQNMEQIKDISGLENINELYESSLIQRYIKKIPIDNTIDFETLPQKVYFVSSTYLKWNELI